VLGATLKAGESLSYAADPGRRLYVVAAQGLLDLNGHRLQARDGAAIRDESALHFQAEEDSEIVMVDAG
jgi:quercetin 2,3-dioxygenase